MSWWRRKSAVIEAERERELAEQQKRVDTAELALRLNTENAERERRRAGIPRAVRDQIDDIATAFDAREVDRVAAEFERIVREGRHRT